MSNWRSKTRVILSRDIGQLYFGQLNVAHQSFFDGLYGTHTRIRLRDLPHYIFWRDDEFNKPEKSLYYKYLSESWKYYYPNENTKAKRIKRINDYIQLYKDIEKEGIKTPIKVLATPDGERLIISGNHRASIAYWLDIDLPVEYIDTKKYISDIVANNKERYGTKKKGAPYQSIYYYENELLRGRRRDIVERFKKIDIADIRGKSVLDSGSNVAMSCMLAWQYGARCATAGEYSPKIGTAALRLSTLIGAEISVETQDWGMIIKDLKSYDTVFSFSLHAHVGNKKNYEKNIVRATKKVLYFEGHERSVREDYEHIFRHFKTVELIGYNSDGVHSKKASRPFFRCEK